MPVASEITKSYGGGIRQLNSYFGSSIRSTTLNRLLLRDPLRLRYFGGLEGLTRSLPETMDFLRAFITRGEFDRVVVLGASAGAHTAFVTGCLIDVEAVICLGCRIDLRQESTSSNKKRKSANRIIREKISAAPDIDKRYLFARDASAVHGAALSPVRIYFDPRYRRDAKHAKMVADLPFVTMVHHRGVGHNIHALAARAFETDPSLVGRGTFHDHVKFLDVQKLQTGERLRAALDASLWEDMTR